MPRPPIQFEVLDRVKGMEKVGITLTLMLMVANLAVQNDAMKQLKNDRNPDYKNLCILVLWMKVTSARDNSNWYN